MAAVEYSTGLGGGLRSVPVAAAREEDCTHAKNIIAGQNRAFLSLKCVDPGSDPKIPSVWHDARAYHGVFILKRSANS